VLSNVGFVMEISAFQATLLTRPQAPGKAVPFNPRVSSSPLLVARQGSRGAVSADKHDPRDTKTQQDHLWPRTYGDKGSSDTPMIWEIYDSKWVMHVGLTMAAYV